MKDLLRGIVYIGVFAVPFIPLIIANSMFFPFITGKNFTFRIGVEIIFAAWVLLALLDAQFRPKFSWILGGFGAFIVVMFFANILGEHPLKSFMSNFERMDGYVTLVHVFLYFVVLGSIMTSQKLWDRFFNTTLIAAVILSLYAFAQLSGNIEITQGSWRLTGTLGNSSYMAVYMLFHVFIAALMFTRTQSQNLRYAYAALIALFAYLLIQTATRGAILGLVGGGFLTVLYITIFSKGRPMLRKVGIGGVAALIVIVGAFIAFKDSEFIQDNRYLSRVASISLEDGETRFTIWGMALEGVKERPILGWGQGNFNYVFNEHYRPSLHGEEPWFDRVHNIVMDWLIAGGILGALAYFSIILAVLYYIVVRPLFVKDETFAVTEQGILLGLFAAYFFHNFFVFDNIVSYIFYGTMLAFVHSRIGTEVPAFASLRIDRKVVEQVAAPVVAVVLVGTIYFVNMPGILAARDIIHALQSQSPQVMMEEFEQALARDSFGTQEVREQLTRNAQAVFNSENIPPETKQEVFKRVEEELLKQIEEKPGDARVYVFVGTFYRMTNNYEVALEQFETARSLSPNKPAIIYEQAFTQLQMGNEDEAREFFREAYELDTDNRDARVYYAAAALNAGQPEIVDELINTDQLLESFAQSDFAVQMAYRNQSYDLLKRMFQARIYENPDNAQYRVNLAVAHYESGDTATAIEILEQAAEDLPAFADQAQGFIDDLRAGRAPGEGAQPDVNVGGEDVEVRSTPVVE